MFKHNPYIYSYGVTSQNIGFLLMQCKISNHLFWKYISNEYNFSTILLGLILEHSKLKRMIRSIKVWFVKCATTHFCGDISSVKKALK